MTQAATAGILGGVLDVGTAGLGELWKAKVVPKGEALEAAGKAKRLKVLEEIEDEKINSIGGKKGGASADMYRTFERARQIVDGEIPGADAVAIDQAAAWLEGEQGKKVASAISQSISESLGDKAGIWEGLGEELRQAIADKPGNIAAGLSEPIEGSLAAKAGPRLFDRYGKRIIMSLIGNSILPGTGAVAGYMLGPAKDVFKRIIQNPEVMIELGRFLQRPLETLPAIFQLQKQAETLSGRIGDLTAALVRGGIKGAEAVVPASIKAITSVGIPELLTKDNYAEKSKQLDHLLSNPNVSAEAAVQQYGPWANHAPGFVGNAVQGQQRVNTFIQQALRQHLPYVNPMQSLLGQAPEPNAHDLHLLNDKLHLALNPVDNIGAKMLQGSLTTQDVQNLRALYPGIANAIQVKLFDEVTQALTDKMPLANHVRQTLETFSGGTMDPLNSPQSIQATQSLFMQPPPQPKPNKAAGKITLGSRTETPGAAAVSNLSRP